jgi:FixJ family two-component response regulator
LAQPKPIVFVVDDDISLREALESLIDFEGFSVETFSSAEAFLERARPEGASCLVLDVTLPALSGLDRRDTARPGAQRRHVASDRKLTDFAR